MTIVQVSPGVGDLDPQTNVEDEEGVSRDIKSSKPIPNGSVKVHDSDINQPTLDQSSSFKNVFNRSKTLDSSASKQYDTSRVKSARSIFSNSESDVFKIEDQVERLSSQIQKNYRNNTKTSNVWNAKRHPLKRLFLCSFIRSPRFFSSDEINMYAKVGDLLLFREGTSFEQEYLSPEVMRGIKSSLDGKYIPKTRYIKMWNHVGIVVHAFDDTSGEYVKYLLYADTIGLRMRKLSEVTNSCVLSHDLCALRPLCVKNTKQQQQYAALVDDLEGLALLSLGGKLLWSNFQQVECNKEVDDIAPCERDMPSPQLLRDNPIIARFHDLFTKRMHVFSFSPSRENLLEATRLFYSMLAVHREKIILEGGGGGGGEESSSVKTLKKIVSLGTVDDGDSQTLPLAMIFNSLSAMNEDEAGESKLGDHEFSVRLRSMLVSMDDNKDGMVSLNEFIDAFLKIPCDNIPVDFDLPAVAMGETVACLFVALGVLREDALTTTPMTFFHPQSFSSSSNRETELARKENMGVKKATAVAAVTKSMMVNPKLTKFKKDILLRSGR